MQFNNLLPLIHNAMAEGNINYIVGDPKQSIYKWRNANVNQFVKLSKHKEIPLEKLKSDWEKFKSNIHSLQLNYNYRSTKTIVEFNNHIFNNLQYENFSLIKSVYENTQQESTKNNNSHVEITEYQNKSNKNEYLNQFAKVLVEKINDCIKNGFKQKDICILLRTKSDITNIINLTHNTELCNKENLSYISPEGLLLYYSKEISFITSFLKQLINHQDKISSAICWEYIKKGEYKNESFYYHYQNNSNFNELFGDIAIQKKNLYQICLDIVEYFKIPFDKYVQKFLDIVNKFAYQYALKSNTIDNFLNFWKENETNFTIDISKDLNAVKIMTIHKSKGLEFPVVITYLNFDNKPNNYWYALPDDYKIILSPPQGNQSEIIEDFQGLYFYLNLKDDIQKINTEKYLNIIEEEELENINLIYVAFTRAINRLYIFAQKDNTYYKNIIYPKIQHFNKSQTEDSTITYYYKENNYTSKPTSITKNIDSNDNITIDTSNITLSYNSNMLIANKANPYSDEQIDIGIKVHKILEFINDNNIESAINKALAKGIISIEEKEKIISIIQPLVEYDLFKKYLSVSNIQKILNETEIYYHHTNDDIQDVYRPDKIIFTKDNSVIVLEFKTGKELSKHKKQIEKYINILKDIYSNENKQVMGLLIYLQENKLEVEKIS